MAQQSNYGPPLGMSHEPNPTLRGNGGILAPTQYDDLVKKLLPSVAVDNDTSILRAGFLLGIQHALAVIKKEWVR